MLLPNSFGVKSLHTVYRYRMISVSEIKSWTISEYRTSAEKPISSIPSYK